MIVDSPQATRDFSGETGRSWKISRLSLADRCLLKSVRRERGRGHCMGVGLVRRGDGMGDVLWRGLAESSDFFEIF